MNVPMTHDCALDLEGARQGPFGGLLLTLVNFILSNLIFTGYCTKTNKILPERVLATDIWLFIDVTNNDL